MHLFHFEFLSFYLSFYFPFSRGSNSANSVIFYLVLAWFCQVSKQNSLLVVSLLPSALCQRTMLTMHPI
ncbi:unnamed protein product [Coffea canephora]|uniref:Uncharacterized protein n=1 Tax=Coffea canephora TaxID=49390 RepID=A0A068V4B8_COFCA|nr:unnamed protein product [Coffea canephora]